MSYIILCNTGSDMLSRINTQSFMVEDFILCSNGNRIGPHEITLYKNSILMANNYNNTISVINKSQFEEAGSNKKEKNHYGKDGKYNYIKEQKDFYIGAHPNDIAQCDGNTFVTCGESDSIIVYDLDGEKINFVIPVGRFPHNITLCEKRRLAFISNMGDDSISVIDIESYKEIKRITVENTPIKINLSNNNHYLYVCMSYLGYDKEGYIGIISLESLEVIYKIKVGFSPVDLYEDNGYLYVSNFCGKSISIVNLDELKEEERIDMSGMPRGIIRQDENIFVCDYLNGAVNIINLDTKKIKTTAVGREPNAMALVK
ncbi:YncE family protein [uncultured Clostridium sp.]|uniref:YncE family protein n=1 Tax=uncultured Clostridium sp. TaxID=59620 RepID=UPI0025F41A4C|nr:YncE family protein [uncultured Clostridium sp.]